MKTISKTRRLLLIAIVVFFCVNVGCVPILSGLHTPLNVAEASSFGSMNIGTLARGELVESICIFAADTTASGEPVDTALDAQKQLIIEYLRTDQPSNALDALAELKQNYASRPQYVIAAHELGWEFIQKGDYAAGLRIYHELKTQYPNHQRAPWFQRSISQKRFFI